MIDLGKLLAPLSEAAKAAKGQNLLILILVLGLLGMFLGGCWVAETTVWLGALLTISSAAALFVVTGVVAWNYKSVADVEACPETSLSFENGDAKLSLSASRPQLLDDQTLLLLSQMMMDRRPLPPPVGVVEGSAASVKNIRRLTDEERIEVQEVDRQHVEEASRENARRLQELSTEQVPADEARQLPPPNGEKTQRG